jgi:hypothetical protein
MLVNGHVRPVAYTVELAGKKQPRWRMVYQEPGEKPVPLCGIQLPDTQTWTPAPTVCVKGDHVSALQARRCATAMEWHRRLESHGYTVLQQLRELENDLRMRVNRERQEQLEKKMFQLPQKKKKKKSTPRSQLDEAFGPTRRL